MDDKLKSPCVKDCPDRLRKGACPENLRTVFEVRSQTVGRQALGEPGQHRRTGALCAAERQIRKGRETTHEIGG